VEATTHYNEPEIIAEVSKGLGEAMVGISVSSLPQGQLMAGRGW
jgi:pyridoxal 5'-phosphate synthase pdxS subunit